MNAKFETLIGSDTPTLIDFYATWCGPCQMLAPTLKAVKDRLGDRVVILKIDVDKNQELAASYQVRGVPTMMLYQRGKQLWRESGLLSTEAIVQVILEKAETS